MAVCLWDRFRPRTVAQSQAADGKPDCSHIIGEVVSADERNRSITFGQRKSRFSQLVWTWKTDFKNGVAVDIFSSGGKEPKQV